MKEYIVATGNQVKRLQHTGQDHYEVNVYGGARRIFCTQDCLRDVIRGVFDNRKEQNPYVVIQTCEPWAIYEGLHIIGWTSGLKIEKADCARGDMFYSFDTANIGRFQVLS